MNLPERVNVMKVITYDVADVLTHLHEDGIDDPDIGQVVELIERWCLDDFSCGFGHEADMSELRFTDEDGNEI